MLVWTIAAHGRRRNSSWWGGIVEDARRPACHGHSESSRDQLDSISVGHLLAPEEPQSSSGGSDWPLLRFGPL